VLKLGGRHLAKGLSVGPCIAVGYTQQILESLEMSSNRLIVVATYRCRRYHPR
jgi:hypothetical protein